jgi:hypothetical protein
MNRIRLGVLALTLLVVAAAGVAQDVIHRTVLPPPASSGIEPQIAGGRNGARQAAIAQQNLDASLRYKGTTAVPERNLNADQGMVKRVCEMLSSSDFVPQERQVRYAKLPPNMKIVGWHLFIEELVIRENDSSVRVRVLPELVSPGNGVITCASSYHENYHIAGGKIEFVGGDPVHEDMPIGLMAD